MDAQMKTMRVENRIQPNCCTYICRQCDVQSLISLTADFQRNYQSICLEFKYKIHRTRHRMLGNFRVLNKSKW